MHVARDDKRMEAMRAALRFFAPEAVVLTLPAWDCLPYDRISPNPDLSAARMATLALLAHGVPGPFILLTTVNAATQRLPARAVLREASFSARVGQRVNEEALRGFLSRAGFSPVATVTEPGDYAIRGGIVDIFPPGPGGPVRLDFFGDVLDGARRFDPETQRTTEKLTQVDLAPVSEVILDEAAITRFRQNYRIEFGAAGADDPLYEAVSAGRKHQGMEHWLPFFHDRMETLFDYLPDAAVMLDDQVGNARLSRWEGIEDQFDARREAGWIRSISPPPLACCTWMTAPGTPPWPGTAWCNCRPCRNPPDRACWMRAGGWGAALRPSARWKASACSAPWPITSAACAATPRW